MKKNVFLMLILFSGFFFSINQVNAQCGTPATSCLPDCPNDPWSSPPTVVSYIVEPGCTLKITYSWRFACNEFFDYNIDGVELIGSCSFGTGIDDVLDAATIALLSNNPRNFPMNCSNDIWRSSKSECWQENGACYTPCPPVTCYLELYRFCNGVLQQITNWAPPANCALPCEPVTPLFE